MNRTALVARRGIVERILPDITGRQTLPTRLPQSSGWSKLAAIGADDTLPEPQTPSTGTRLVHGVSHWAERRWHPSLWEPYRRRSVPAVRSE